MTPPGKRRWKISVCDKCGGLAFGAGRSSTCPFPRSSPASAVEVLPASSYDHLAAVHKELVQAVEFTLTAVPASRVPEFAQLRDSLKQAKEALGQ